MNSTAATQLEQFTLSLRQISQGQGHFDRSIQQQIREMLNRLTCPTVTVTFGGHFSSGKSTLLNAAIQRSLLPTMDFPDTGAICTLRAGTRDHVEIILPHGSQTVAYTTASIAQYISLRLSSGMENENVHQVKEVKISLANSPIPERAIWVDSPGINESDAMVERANEAARRADILLWVLNSRQFLSLSEEEFIADYVDEHGPDSVMFVTNIFLERDTLREWNTYLSQYLSVFQKKLAYRAAELGFSPEAPPENITVSARALCSLHHGNNDFGGRDLRVLLAGLNTGNRPRIQRARLFFVARTLRTILATLQARLQEEQDRVRRAQETYEQKLQEHQRRQQRFTSDIESAINQFLANWRSQARNCGDNIARSITADNLSRNGSTYTNNLNTQLKSVATQAMGDLQKRIASAVSQYDQKPLDSDSLAKLQTLLTPLTVSVRVPDTTPSGGNAAGKIGAGLAIGSIVPGIGHLAGALIGAGVAAVTAYSAHNTANQRDAEQTKKNVVAEAERAIRAMEQKRAEAVSLISASCVRAADIRQPDTGKVQALESQLRIMVQLVKQAEELVKGIR
jgi:GTPase Era involved in 16S rRNA processing